jgi:uncharacterized protein (DUF1697 family)
VSRAEQNTQMAVFVVLLRGINVGGNNRIGMADLRAACEAGGLANVRTYIQSGNIVLDAPAKDPEAVAAHVRSIIARTFHLDIPTVALTEAGLAGIVESNPYPDEPNPKLVHAIVLPYELAEPGLTAVAHRQSAAAAKGSRDTVTVVGRTAYLHTPDGFGASDLAKALTSGRSNPLGDGTARNWSTVTALLALCRP